jgi:hypothetical protein
MALKNSVKIGEGSPSSSGFKIKTRPAYISQSGSINEEIEFSIGGLNPIEAALLKSKKAINEVNHSKSEKTEKVETSKTIEVVSVPVKNVADSVISNVVLESVSPVNDSGVSVVQQAIEHPLDVKIVESVVSTNVQPVVSSVADSADSLETEKHGLFKLIMLGFAHIYVKKTSEALSPLNLFIKNLSATFFALLYLLTPATVEYFLIKNVDFINEQLWNDGVVLSYVYQVSFYFACLFCFVMLSMVFSGVFKSIKKWLYGIADLGKKTIEKPE